MKGLGLPRQPAPMGVGAPTQALDLAAVYDEHATLVFTWVSRMAGPGLDAEDLVQEVFLVVRDRLADFRGEAKLTTWLYRIAANVVRDRRRQAWRRWLRHLVAGEEQARARPSGPTPLEELERRRDVELVYRVLDAMKEEYRAVLILFEMEGHSGEEIAELTGVKLETVWVRLHRARAQFRARLGALDPRYLLAEGGA
jgi:RNA polymerase sigma-70 factor (ECF subfamily)